MRTRAPFVLAALVPFVFACGPTPQKKKTRATAPPPPAGPAAPLPPPPPGPPPPSTGPKAEPVTEIVEMLEKTHPDLLVSLAGMGDRATSAAKAPARDPVRAEKFRQALDGPHVLAELTQKMSDDPASGVAAVRTWLTTEEGKAFAAARKYEVEVRKTRSNLAGPSIERRNAARRLVNALGDGRFHGLTDFSVLTQAFLGTGAPGKIAGDFHQRLIDQGPWLLERASSMGTATENWAIPSIESVTTFWESPAGRDYISAIDRHLTATIEARIAQAEAVPPPPPPPATTH